MKLQILALLIFAGFSSFGQDMKLDVDTLKIIHTRKLHNQDIRFTSKEIEFKFSKSATLKALSETIHEERNQIDSSSNSKYLDGKHLKDSTKSNLDEIVMLEKVREYISNQKRLTLSDPWENDTVKSEEQIKNNILLYAGSIFSYIASKMLDSGEFILISGGKLETTIIKTKVIESGPTHRDESIRYYSQHGKELMRCCPCETMLWQPAVEEEFIKIK